MAKQHTLRHGFFCAAALAALVLTACGGQDTRVVQSGPPIQSGNTPSPKIPRPDLIQPALNTISSRIRSYEARLGEIKAIENSPSSMMIPHGQMERLSKCKSELLDILTGYDSLQKRLTRESDLDMAQNMANNMLQQVNQQDMQFLEGDCGRLLSDLKNGSYQTTPNQMVPPPSASLSPAAAPDPQIQAAFDSGDYPRVITLYNQNWAGTGRQPAAATSLQYSRALLKNYQFEEAQNQLAALDAALGQQNDPLAAEVLRVLGDLAFGNGNYQAAQQYYGRLAHLPSGQSDSWSQRQLAVLQQQTASGDELAAYTVLVHSYLAYNPARDGNAVATQAEKFLNDYPASRLVANVNDIIKNTRRDTAGSLDANAAPAVPGAPSPDAPAGGSGAPQAPSPAPLSAEQIAAREQALKEQYEHGVAQMSGSDYDGAIQTFNSLLGSSFNQQARERIREAATMAGDVKRAQAAELFVQAMQTGNIGTRKQLLLSSRQLLLDVRNNYPEAGLGSKVERNLDSVEKALRAIDPSLLR